MLGREERMMELMREVNELLSRLGQPPRYPNPGEPAAGIPEAPKG